MCEDVSVGKQLRKLLSQYELDTHLLMKESENQNSKGQLGNSCQLARAAGLLAVVVDALRAAVLGIEGSQESGK